MNKIPFIKPVFPSPEELRADFEAIVERNYYTNSGPVEKQLSSDCSTYIGNDVSTSIVSNGTIALFLAIKALCPEVKGSKNKILIQSFTFAAGAEAILWCGFEPIFIDVEEGTWQPSLKQTKEYLGENGDDVAAILACNSFGTGNTKIGKWEDLAKQHHIPLIIDSAAGFGSTYNSKHKVGSRGDCEIFSLHATKPFAVGEGGAVTSRDKKLIEKIDQLKNFGFDNNREVSQLGLNAKMPEILAAIGVSQVEKIAARVAKHQELLEIYKELLLPAKITFQSNAENSSLPFASVFLPGGVNREKVLENLKKDNIEARTYYNPPLHSQQLFQGFKQLNLKVTGQLCKNILSLPLYEEMNRSDIERICAIIISGVKKT